MNKIYYKTELCIGNGALTQLSTYKNKKIFVVSDPFLVESSQIDEMLRYLDESNHVIIFKDIVPDPPIEIVAKGIKEAEGQNIDIVIAIGGGSAIDAAKAMYYFGKKQAVFVNTLFIAIPTTSGTGSEVTDFSIITDLEKGIKYPLISKDILPAIAILDAKLVETVPPNVTADTGMDVLTHAIEAYVSTLANDFSDALAEKAVQLVFKYLPIAFKDGKNQEAREKMHYASTLAGMAFNTASLGLNHGIAHAAGAKLHVPHGRLNSILMPHIIHFNANITRVGKVGFDRTTAMRYQQLAKLLGCSASNPAMGVRQFIGLVKDLQKKLQMPVSLREYGVSSQDFTLYKEEIAKGALLDRCNETNPRQATVDEVINILELAF